MPKASRSRRASQFDRAGVHGRFERSDAACGTREFESSAGAGEVAGAGKQITG